MNRSPKKSFVTEINPAEASDAHAHFSAALRYETDCWDVHAALTQGDADFVLLDVRGPDAFNGGHVDGAVNVPHGKITFGYMAKWPVETVFVVYCAGPHCNGACRAAVRLSELKRPVKLMIGGVTGWLDEGFELVVAESAQKGGM